MNSHMLNIDEIKIKKKETCNMLLMAHSQFGFLYQSIQQTHHTGQKPLEQICLKLKGVNNESKILDNVTLKYTKPDKP